MKVIDFCELDLSLGSKCRNGSNFTRLHSHRGIELDSALSGFRTEPCSVILSRYVSECVRTNAAAAAYWEMATVFLGAELRH